MATLELAIDATKAQQGAQVAEQAMKRVQTAAEGTGKAVQDAGSKMSAAFQATGGSIQIAGGLAQTAKAFGELNVQAGLFNSSRLLLEIGKTAQDFRELSAGVTGVSGAFSTLTAIVKANPLLAAATAIGTIASAIGLFASETKKATTAYSGFTEELAKTRISDEAAKMLGIAVSGEAGRTRALRQAAEYTAAGGVLTTGQLPGYEREMAQFLVNQGVYGDLDSVRRIRQQVAARQFLETGGTTRMGPGQFSREEFFPGLPGDIILTRQQTEELLKELYQTNQKQLEADKASAAAAQETARIRQQFLQDLQNNPPIGVDPDVLMARPHTPRPEQRLPTAEEVKQGVRGYLSQPDYSARALEIRFGEALGSAADALQNFVRKANATVAGLADPSGFRAAAATYIDPVADRTRMVSQLPGAERRRAFFEEQRQQRAAEDEAEKAKLAASERVKENFARAADYAGHIGGSLGSAFADVLMKTTTLRQAFASIVASFARQGLSDIGAAMFRGVVEGLTPNQQRANVGINTGVPAPNPGNYIA